MIRVLAEVEPFCEITGCTCPTGYELIEYAVGQTCRVLPPEDVEKETETETLPCDVENNCSVYAQCEWVESELRNKCVCNPQYEGDGYVCTEVEVSCIYVGFLLRENNCQAKVTLDRFFCNRKTFAIREHRAAMTKRWESQSANVRMDGKAMVVTVIKRQSVAAMKTVVVMLYVSMESVHVSKDSRETYQTCKGFPFLLQFLSE